MRLRNRTINDMIWIFQFPYLPMLSANSDIFSHNYQLSDDTSMLDDKTSRTRTFHKELDRNQPWPIKFLLFMCYSCASAKIVG